MQRQFNRNLKRFGIGLFGNKGSGFVAEYQAVYDYFGLIGIQPSAEVATEQNTMVKSKVANGLWYSKDIYYVFAGHTNDNGESLINWRNPGTYDATIVLNGGTMNFTSFEGFQSDDGAYIESGWNVLNNSVNYTLNDASVGGYARLNKAEDGCLVGALLDPIYIDLFPKASAGTSFLRINGGATSLAGDVIDPRGMWIGIRDGVNSVVNYHNKEGNIGTTGSVSIPNETLTFLSRTGLLPSTNQISNGFAGSSLTQLEVSKETDIFETYMVSNGKGVITVEYMTILGNSISSPEAVKWTDNIPRDDYSVINYAVSGDKIIPDMDDQVVKAAGIDPNIIIIFLGTNDDNAGNMATLQAEVEENIIELKSTNPNSILYYVNILPRWTNVTGTTEVDKSNLRTAILAACNAQNITCWDTYDTPWILPEDTSDGLHPDASGQTKIWNEINARI